MALLLGGTAFVLQGGRPIYSDGSALGVGLLGLGVGACALAQKDSDGRWRVAIEVIPRHLPASSAQAEHRAIDFLGRIAAAGWDPAEEADGDEVALITDCQSVISYFGSETLRSGGNSPFAGYWRAGQATGISSIHKIKSHLSEATAIKRGIRIWWEGNKRADEACGAAVPKFSHDPKGWADKIRCVVEDLIPPLAALAATHPWNPMKRLKQARRPARAANSGNRFLHSYLWVRKRWVCRWCGISKTGLVGSADRKPCAALMRHSELVTVSHTLFVGTRSASGTCPGAAILFCKTCGRYASSRVVGLKRACPGAVIGSKGARDRLCRGQHPVDRLPISDIRRVRRWGDKFVAPLPWFRRWKDRRKPPSGVTGGAAFMEACSFLSGFVRCSPAGPAATVVDQGVEAAVPPLDLDADPGFDEAVRFAEELEFDVYPKGPWDDGPEPWDPRHSLLLVCCSAAPAPVAAPGAWGFRPRGEVSR